MNMKIENIEDPQRYQAPPDTPDAYQEGYDAFFELKPTPENYLDIVVESTYQPDTRKRDVFYQGVGDAKKYYERNL